MSKIRRHGGGAPRTITLNGMVAGKIWMPAVTCGKQFRLTDKPGPWGDFEGSRPTIREMALKATGDGDFQHCRIIDATVTFTRTTPTRTGAITRTRQMDIRQFKSVADCVVTLESDEYFEGLDCFSD